MFEKFRIGGDTPSKENVEPNAGAAADHLRVAAAAEVEKDLSQRPRRKYTRRDTGGERDQRAIQDEVNRAVIAQLDQLHEPRAWSALLSLPGDCALALTGKDRWKISDDERATLGATGSALARTMMITNPKALAIAMFAGAMMSVYGMRFIGEMEDWRKKKEQEKKDAPKT